MVVVVVFMVVVVVLVVVMAVTGSVLRDWNLYCLLITVNTGGSGGGVITVDTGGSGGGGDWRCLVGSIFYSCD